MEKEEESSLYIPDHDENDFSQKKKRLIELEDEESISSGVEGRLTESRTDQLLLQLRRWKRIA